VVARLRTRLDPVVLATIPSVERRKCHLSVLIIHLFLFADNPENQLAFRPTLKLDGKLDTDGLER
jgi:hypothetical protein